MWQCQIAIGRSLILYPSYFPISMSISPLPGCMQAISTNQPDPSRRLLLGILVPYIPCWGYVHSNQSKILWTSTIPCWHISQGKQTLLRVIPTMTFQDIYFVHIPYSDILPTFLSDTYSDIYSDIMFVFV